MALTYEEQGGLLAQWCAEMITTPLGSAFYSRMVDSSVLSAPSDRYGRRYWAAAPGRTSIVFPNRERMLQYAYGLAGKACTALTTERDDEVVKKEVAQFLRECHLFYGAQAGILQRLALPASPGQQASLDTLIGMEFTRCALHSDALGACAAKVDAVIERFLLASRQVVIRDSAAGIGRFLHRTANDPGKGISAAAQSVRWMKAAWTSAIQKIETAHQAAAAQLEAASAGATRVRRQIEQEQRQALAGAYRSRLVEAAMRRKEEQSLRIASEVLTELLAELERWDGRIAQRLGELETLCDRVQAEGGRLERLNLAWRSPNGLVLPATAADYHAMLRGEGDLSRREAAAISRMWGAVVGAHGHILDSDMSALEGELVCRALLHFRPRDVMEAIVEQRGEQGALDLLCDTLRDSRELVPLNEAEIDRDASQRMLFIAVKGGERSLLAQVLKRVKADSAHTFLVDHGCADSIILHSYRFGFQLGALAALEAYAEADAEVRRDHEGELCHTDPNYRDLPDLKPIKSVDDTQLDNYLVIGKAVGAIRNDAEGWFFMPLRGRPVSMGADENAARAWLVEHQDRLVHIASRWIAGRILEGTEAAQGQLDALARNGYSGDAKKLAVVECLKGSLKACEAFSLVPGAARNGWRGAENDEP